MKKISIMKPAILVCSAGLLLTACSSNDYAEPTHAYSPPATSQSHDDSWMRGSGTEQSQYTQSYSAQPSQQAQDNIVIPLYEEQLKGVGKRTVDAGQVTIRKTVTTQTVSKPIELRQESLVIDREAAGSQASSASSAESERAAAEQSVADEPAGAAPSSGTAFQEQTFTIRLQKEEPVIQKSVVQTGKVTARKESQTAQQNVEEQIRKEDVQLDKSGANVEIRGNFEAAGKEVSEPAGAESREYIIEVSPDDSLDDRTPTQGRGVQDLREQPDDLE